MSKPQFEGRKGATSTPRADRNGVQLPSAPRRGQLAPPSASTVASAMKVNSPPGVPKRSAPSPVQPCHLWRAWKTTPLSSSRRSQARSRGDAFIMTGKTRPELPSKVSIPSSAAHALISFGVKALSAGSSCSLAAPKRVRKVSRSSPCVMLRPLLPARRNFRPSEGMASKRWTSATGASRSAAMRPAGPPPIIAATGRGEDFPEVSFTRGSYHPPHPNAVRE